MYGRRNDAFCDCKQADHRRKCHRPSVQYADLAYPFDVSVFQKKPSRLEVINDALVLIGILCFFFDSLSTGRIAGDLIALFRFFYAGMFMLNQFEKGMPCPPW